MSYFIMLSANGIGLNMIDFSRNEPEMKKN